MRSLQANHDKTTRTQNWGPNQQRTNYLVRYEVAISLSRLASAVANEGSIGVISAAMPGIHEAVKIFEKQKATRIPIIAAGGIFDGFDIFKFLALGAASVQKGTRFVATSECDVDDAFKQA